MYENIFNNFMYSLLSKVSIPITLLKEHAKNVRFDPPSSKTLFNLAKNSYKGRLPESSHNHKIENTPFRRPLASANSERLLEIQTTVNEYFEAERKHIFIDICSMERKNDSLLLKYVMKNDGSEFDRKHMNEMAKLVRYKLRKLPNLASIKKVLLIEDTFQT